MHYSKIFPLTYLYLLLVTPASFFLVNSLITSLNELEWNDEERLAKNYVLYLESYCNIELGNFYIQEMPMSLHLLHQFHIFNKFQNENCIAIGLLKGTRKDHLIYPLYENIYDESIEYKEWMRNFHRKEIGWKSEHSHDLEIYFSDVEGGNILVANLHPGEQNTVWLDTYLGHIFRVLDPISDEIIDEILVEYDSYHTYFISFDQYELKNLNNEKDILDGVNDTLHHEFSRSLNVHRTFTPLGFDKATLPLDIYGSMMTYYYNNYNSIYIEDWMGMFHVNWWESHPFMVGMPWKLKRYWQTHLRKLVEKWIGGNIPLENSDIYGMRRYERGAWLLSHVDRESTHAVSLIINLEQRGMEKDWMVEIYDHAGRLHEIPMEPGDIVYYESAKSLHGRMAPLHGVSYSNLFSHYRPVGDPEWYTRSNPPDTPAPILDLDEAFQNHEMQCSAAPVDSSSPSHECRFQSGDNDEGDLHLSYEQRKQRWIAKTLPYWSKDIPPVHDGNGLFEYWKKVNNILEKKETV